MSEELQDSLDYPSKLSRNLDVIRNLMADGEKQVQAFLADLSKPANTIQEAANKLRGIS